MAGALLAGVCWLARHYFLHAGSSVFLWQKLLGVSVTVAVGSAIFFGTAYLLRVAEVEDLVALARRKLGR